MTKQRSPLSFERALVRIADHVGWAAMGSAIGKSGRTVLDYSDEDSPTGITLADAFAIEELYILSGGEGRPIHDCWRVRLDAAEAATTPCHDELTRRTGIAAKETGEAVAALVHTLTQGADAVDRRAARREVQEGIDALTATLPLLDDGAGPPVAAGEGHVPGGTA